MNSKPVKVNLSAASAVCTVVKLRNTMIMFDCGGTLQYEDDEIVDFSVSNFSYDWSEACGKIQHQIDADLTHL